MTEAAQAATTTAVTPGWKGLAVLIGLAVVVLIYLVAAISSGQTPSKLIAGADGRPSTSKFQWLLWITVIIFAYTVLWVLRARQGNYSAISQVPVNLLTVLGFSTGTAAAANGITAGYIRANLVAKPAAGSKQGGLLQDDNGVPELAKIQILGFTVVAAGIFLATLVHQIASNPVVTGLPNLDSSLLVLVGISQGGYLGKKLVTFGAPVLYPPVPDQAAAGAGLELAGAHLGSPPAGAVTPPGGQLTLNGTPIPVSTWSDSAISVDLPRESPADGGAPWPPSGPVQLAVTAAGRQSNAVRLTITPAASTPAHEPS